MKHGLNQDTIFSHLFKATTTGLSVKNTSDGPSDYMCQSQTKLFNLKTECFSNTQWTIAANSSLPNQWQSVLW